jgi:NAD(P)H-hydrate repair Nnr-like enzyme with NAD(P)H-hydrate epimerase domain
MAVHKREQEWKAEAERWETARPHSAIRWAGMGDNSGDNLYTTQTLDNTKDKYNVKIKSERVSPKVSQTTYIDRRVKERRSKRGDEIINKIKQ